MIDYNYNPDYPTKTNGGFLQHTTQYRPEMNNNSFFYPGNGVGNGAVSPFIQQTPVESRRNDGMNYGYYQNPQPMPAPAPAPIPMQTAPTMQNSLYSAEPDIKPFSTYPNNNVQHGFNALVESRRYEQNTSLGNNPWANQVPNPQTVPTPPPVAAQPAVNPWQDPYMYYPNNGYSNDCSALYGNNNFGFDRKNACWENQCTMNRPIDMPHVNWNPQPTYQQPMQVPQYPQYFQSNMTYPDTNMTWKERAEKNWNSL